MNYLVKKTIGFAVLALSLAAVLPAESAFARLKCNPSGDFCSFCSPKAKQSSVSTVEKTLIQTAAMPEFKDASEFSAFVAWTSALKTADAKWKAYFSAIGVNADDSKEVLSFVGARDHTAYYRNAESQLKLTPKQSEILIENISKTLTQLISG